jgi:hypothetical protein
MAPSIDEAPELPERNTITVDEYPDHVLYPVEELNELGLYILKMQTVVEFLQAKLQYYIDITNWDKNKSEE